MNRGWIKWAAESRPTTKDAPALASAWFTARPQPNWIATASDAGGAIDRSDVKILGFGSYGLLRVSVCGRALAGAALRKRAHISRNNSRPPTISE